MNYKLSMPPICDGDGTLKITYWALKENGEIHDGNLLAEIEYRDDAINNGLCPVVVKAEIYAKDAGIIQKIIVPCNNNVKVNDAIAIIASIEKQSIDKQEIDFKDLSEFKIQIVVI